MRQDNLFEPLTAEEKAASDSQDRAERQEPVFSPILPVPPEAPPAPKAHPTRGIPDARHEYRDRDAIFCKPHQVACRLKSYVGEVGHDFVSAVDQLFVFRLHADHVSLIDVAAEGHGAGADLVEHEFGGGAGFEARGACEYLRTRFQRDKQRLSFAPG